MELMASNPRVSIIIPCYNYGSYIDEALASVELINEKELFEVIIIDDGSTDAYTIGKLKELEEAGDYKVLYQPNQGVSAARNNGISQARGEFILSLDADNKIHPDYVYKSLKVFDSDSSIDVIYAHAAFFGDEQGVKYQMPFNLQALLTENFIDTCAIFRKKLWEAVGGYDPSMRSGLEDWEFWLHAAFKGYKFHHIDEVLFDYRVTNRSRTATLVADKTNTNHLMDYMAAKHPYYYGPKYVDDILIKRFKFSPVGFFVKLFLRVYFPRMYNKYVEQGKFRKYIV